MGGQFSRRVEKVAANCDADSVRITLLAAVVDDDSGVGNCVVLGDSSNLFMGKKLDSVCSFFVPPSL